jgi:hypothetical protein
VGREAGNPADRRRLEPGSNRTTFKSIRDIRTIHLQHETAVHFAKIAK